MENLTADSEYSNMTNVSLLPVIQHTSFEYSMVNNLGLCVSITDYLAWLLRISAIIQVVISLPGLLGAALALRVCTRQNRSSISVQVALLSFYDLTYLFAVLLLASFQLADVTGDSVEGPFLVLRQLGQWGIAYTLLDISIERCICIDRPFLAKKVCGVGFTLKRAAVVFALGIAFTSPFVVDLVYHFSSKGECERERSLTMYGAVYTLYTVTLFFILLPFTVIVVANVRLAYTLRHIGKRTRSMTANSSSVVHVDSSARQLSSFVEGMSAWYVACMLVPSILFLVRLTRIELFRPEIDVLAAVVADVLIVLSATANFFFYFLLWRHFRETFFILFCSKCRSTDLTSVASDTLSLHYSNTSSGKHSLSPDQISTNKPSPADIAPSSPY